MNEQDERTLNLALRMHDVQYERANRLEAEYAALVGHVETLLADLKKADAHHFSIGLMAVRLRAMLPAPPQDPS